MRMIIICFIIALAISFWLFPYAIPILCVIFLFFNLSVAVLGIFKKYKQAEYPRLNITKEILLLLLTILLVIFLGGLAGLFASYYITPVYGIVAGLISALTVSFSLGYLVKWEMGAALENFFS
jgi:O-antigen/teichoic acid export membrane protein